MIHSAVLIEYMRVKIIRLKAYFLETVVLLSPSSYLMTSGVHVFRNLKREGGEGRGYISGVYFQMCSKFRYNFFTLNISTKKFSPQKGGTRPPKYAPIDGTPRHCHKVTPV